MILFQVHNNRARKVLYFHATRKIDLEPNGNWQLAISFDKINAKLGNALNAVTGTFTVPKPGVYLLIFREVPTFRPFPKNKQVGNFGFTFSRMVQP